MDITKEQLHDALTAECELVRSELVEKLGEFGADAVIGQIVGGVLLHFFPPHR